MMRSVVHRSEERGKADFGWLQARQSFSFGRYFDPEKIHFGALRVLNDDYIAGGRGFDTHSHDNMEIVTIPLEGSLRHKDSMGHEAVIRPGDIQVMSAGTGISHSEFNHLSDQPCKLLQLWMFPREKGVEPRYGDLALNWENKKNELIQIISPNPGDDEGSWVHQDAWLHLGKFDVDQKLTYQIKKETNGVYVFVIEGEIQIGSERLERRDAIGIWEDKDVEIEIKADSHLLLIDVPMEVRY